MADHAAAAQIEQILRAAGPRECLRRLAAPLARSRHRQWPIARREQGLLKGLERPYEGLVGFPIFGADAVDLELVDAQQAPELLIDAKIQPEAGMTRENVPTIAVSVQNQARTLAQKRETAIADRIDVDDRGIAAGAGDDVVIAKHDFGIGVGNPKGVHRLLAGLLFAIQYDRPDSNRPGSSTSRRP